MNEYNFIVEFSVRRGLGPVWERKDVPVCIDDARDITESDARDYAKMEAKLQLARMGYRENAYNYVGIQNA